jgi:hypothetical protein
MANIPDVLEVKTDPYGRYRKTAFRHGLWRALVVNVQDPENRGRIQVRVLLLHPESAPLGATTNPVQVTDVLQAPPGQGVSDDLLPWAEPCFPWGGNIATAKDPNDSESPGEDPGLTTEGFFAVPSVGSTVWVAFDMGFTGNPVWLGTWYGLNELPEEITDPANVRLMKTPGGHVLIFDDTPGATKILLATLAQDSSQAPHTVRLIELDDAAKTLKIQNTSDPAGDPRAILQDETNKKTRIDEGTDRFVEMDQTGTKTTIQEGVDRKLELDQATTKNTLQQNPIQTIIQDGAANVTTITNGAVVITLDGASGSAIITNGVTTITVAASGATTVSGPAGAPITLGTGASEGVCLDSLIDIINTMVTVFNSHTHPGDSGGTTGSPNSSQVGGVKGTNSSNTVTAKL